ncbi:MAG: hypothetical protein CMC36_00365 [Flavobacteriaceae bacterium]|nr:hypothetical protein [Flavobacteriaceae bacterium]
MRYSLVLIYILFFNQMFSQDVQQVEVLKNDKQVTELFDEIGNSEIKLDVIDLLSQPALNIGYEKINDSYSSYGADIFLNFNDNNASRSWSEKFSLNPFYRFYFLNKTDFGGEGYFAEVFIKFSNIEYERDTYFYNPMPNEPYSTTEEIKAWDIAPGVGVGRKWVNKKGWTFEYMLGFGRYLFAKSGNDNPDSDYEVDNYRPEATFKGGISIGKRF